MEKVIKIDELKREFRIWCSSILVREGISKKELAERIDAPFSRVSEAINGKGKCKKYIPLIIRALGCDEDLQRFGGLYN